jgi:hypothetical protein
MLIIERLLHSAALAISEAVSDLLDIIQSISKTVYPLDTLTLFLGPYPSIR